MLSKVDADTKKAYLNLQLSPSFNIVKEHLIKSLKETDEYLRTSSIDKIQIAQGHAQILKELIDLVSVMPKTKPKQLGG